MSYNGGESVENLVEGDGDTFALDPGKRGTIYLARGSEILQTSDGGTIWNSIFIETESSEIGAIAVHPKESARIFAITRNGSLFGSEDTGASWRLVKKIRIKTVRELIINPQKPEEMHITTDYEGIFKSADGGVNWNVLHTLEPFEGSKRVRQFKMNHRNPLHLFLASDAGFLVSEDGGESWRALTLLSAPGKNALTAIGFNPLRERDLYYGTRDSLFKSADGGGSWSILPLYVSGTPVEILVDEMDGNIVYIGVGSD